jgi:ATP-dependent DNA ligase
MLMLRYPDKPKGVIHRAGLHDLPGFFAQVKADGFRCQIELRGAATDLGRGPIVTFTSRHNKPVPVSDDLRRQVEAFLYDVRAVDGTIIDAEWLGRRAGVQREQMLLFDLLQLGQEEQLWAVPAWARWHELLQLWRGDEPLMPRDEPWTDEVPFYRSNVRLVPTTESGFAAFFDRHQGTSEFEGVVLKSKMSRYIGSTRSSAENPGWFKCKWRSGDDGQTKIT